MAHPVEAHPIQGMGDRLIGATETAQLALISDSEELTHIVCCRDPIWDTGLCGQPGDSINLAATFICSMCLEIALGRLPSFLENDPAVCPMDLHPCPSEHEIDLRVLDEVTPPE